MSAARRVTTFSRGSAGTVRLVRVPGTQGGQGRDGIAAAAAAAGAAGVKTWALTGQAPNAVASACTEAVCVDAVARSTIEEVQVAAIHIFCSAVNAAMRDAIRAGHQSDLA